MNDAPEWIRLDVSYLQERFAAMSPTAIGCFMLLVTHQLAFGSVPSDPKAVERLAPGSKRCWAELAPLFSPRADGLANPYFAEARSRALELRDSYRTRGRNGAEARWSGDADRGGRRPPDGPADGPAARSTNGLATAAANASASSSANGSAMPGAIPAAIASSEYESDKTPSSSLRPTSGERRRTTDGMSPRLQAAVRKLPPTLSDAEVDEATAILATWPDASVLAELNRLLAQARSKDIPHAWLMGCLRRRRPAREVEPVERPAVAGRIDPVLANQREAERRAAIERADADALLAALDDAALAALHRRVAAAAATDEERRRLAALDPRRSHLLRAILANALANGRPAPPDARGGHPVTRPAHAATS